MPDPSIPQVVLMGLITVFIVLICLIIIIVILGKIMVAVTGKKTESPAAPRPRRRLPLPPRPPLGAAWQQPAAGGRHRRRHCRGHGGGRGPHQDPVHPPRVSHNQNILLYH